MVAFSIWAAAIFATIGVTSAADPIHVPLRRAEGYHKTLNRRAVASPVQLYNAVQQGGYAIDLLIGTPAQNFSVIIDTGSTELWVPGPSCPNTECFGALFNTSLSSTYVATTNPINLTYTLGSFNGTYARDTVSIGGYTVQNLTFGVIKTAANNTQPVAGEPYLNGVFGLAFPTLTYSSETLQFQYDPFIFALWKAKQIPQSIFSIYLGSRLIEGETGLITFGGVDTSKYTGNLQWLQVQKESDGVSSNYYHWNILLVGLSATLNGKETSNLLGTTGAVTLLDTGTTFSFMPYSVVYNMLIDIEPTAVYAQGAFYVDCSLATSTGTINFAFANTTAGTGATIISASISSLVIPLDTLSPSTAQQCVWGILAEDGVYLLGDTFLQSVYVVHDFVNYSVGMAAASWTNLTTTSAAASGSGNSGATSTGGVNNGQKNSAQCVGSSAVKIFTCLALVVCVNFLL